MLSSQEETMTKGAVAFAVNDRVSHAVYGTGTICELNPRHTTIVFDEAGRKKFVTSMVQLEHSTTAAPPVPAAPGRRKTAKVVKAVKAAK
jgi:hypothetical protein